MRKSESSLRLDTLDKELADIDGYARAVYWGHICDFAECDTLVASIEARLKVLPDIELITNAADEKIKAKAAATKSASDDKHG